MKTISNSFFRMSVHCMFFIIIPVFYFLFVLSYKPFDIEEFYSVGRDRFSFNLIISTLIVGGTVTLSRILLFLLRKVIRLNWSLYILWCTGEVVFAGMMTSILISLSMAEPLPYFQVMTTCLLYMAGILVFPYTLITMAVQLYVLDRRGENGAIDEKSLVRFYDETGRAKFISASESILYIEAEENYVHIHHLHNEREKDYVLRSSMRALEENVTRHGLVRCHRSFFVNPAHITLVRKDPKAGYAIAELDHPGAKNIPVSKNYYDVISSLL